MIEHQGFWELFPTVFTALLLTESEGLLFTTLLFRTYRYGAGVLFPAPTRQYNSSRNSGFRGSNIDVWPLQAPGMHRHIQVKHRDKKNLLKNIIHPNKRGIMKFHVFIAYLGMKQCC